MSIVRWLHSPQGWQPGTDSVHRLTCWTQPAHCLQSFGSLCQSQKRSGRKRFFCAVNVWRNISFSIRQSRAQLRTQVHAATCKENRVCVISTEVTCWFSHPNVQEHVKTERGLAVTWPRDQLPLHWCYILLYCCYLVLHLHYYSTSNFQFLLPFRQRCNSVFLFVCFFPSL